MFIKELNKYSNTLTMVLLGVLLTACNSKTNINLDDDKIDQIQGIWERKGYGEIFEIKDDTAVIYEHTRNTCIKTSTVNGQELEDYVDTIKLAEDKQSFTAQDEEDVFISLVTKISALPSPCLSANLLTESTPGKVFDHFWNNFNDYYAFFNERSIDWNQQYATYHPQVRDDMNDQELFNLLETMLTPFDDAHVELSSGFRSFSPGSPSVFIQQLIEAFQQQTEFTDLSLFVAEQFGNAQLLSSLYVSNMHSDGGKNKDVVFWGEINNGEIGYINFTQMIGFSDRFVRGDTSPDDLDAADELAALARVLDTIMDDLKDTRSIIIDVRFNPGGSDIFSLMITNRFSSQRQRVLSKHTRTFAGNTPQVHAYTKPTSTPYTKPVVVLSSDMTVSAAEIFLITMRALPNVTPIGDPSTGALSDILEKQLPNGWSTSFSNEVYLDYLGNNHEVSGVPMDIHIPAITVADLIAEKDSALEAAIQSLGSTSTQ